MNNNDIKFINSLNRKKNRDESGLFIVEGVKVVNELIDSEYQIEKIYATENWGSDITFEKISPKELGRITQLKSPNKVLALAKKPENLEILNNTTSIVIDHVNDPGNLGTIIRTADWFGIRQVICSEESVDVFNSKVVMATMGSLFRVNVVYTNLEKYLSETKIPVYGALLDGESIYNTKFENPSLLLLGSESHGIDKKLFPFIIHKTTIPGSGTAESLNLGISTALFASEYFRQNLLS